MYSYRSHDWLSALSGPETWRSNAPAADVMQVAIEPWKAVLKCQAEWVGYVSRRAQSDFELSSRLRRCRTPAEFAQVQSEYWQTAIDQSRDSTARMMQAWARTLGPGHH